LTVWILVRKGSINGNHLQFETGDVQQLATLDDLVAELLELERDGGIELERLEDENAEEEVLEPREEDEDAAASELELDDVIDDAMERAEAWLREDKLEDTCDELKELLAESNSEEPDRDRLEDDVCEEEAVTLGITGTRTDDAELATEDAELAEALEFCEGDGGADEDTADDSADETRDAAVESAEEATLDVTWLADATDEDCAELRALLADSESNEKSEEAAEAPEEAAMDDT
jgi:hypothetical protein